MRESDKSNINLICGYIEEILEYCAKIDYLDFIHDRKTLHAVSFCVEQIGELSNKISAELKDENAQIPWRSMVGLRNRITHDYQGVNPVVLWTTIKENLPQLLNDLNLILTDRGAINE